MASSSELSYHERIKAYYANCPDTIQFIGQSYKPPAQSTNLEKGVEDIKLNDSNKRAEEIRKAFLYTGGLEDFTRNRITDKVAKESSDSTASTHKLHNEGNNATSGGSIGAMAHKANPGPVMADNLPSPASKEELKKRAQELNE